VSKIDPRAAQKVQPELMSGESIYWAGMPNPSVIFHSDDWYVMHACPLARDREDGWGLE
jgi:hypothetical protein